MWGTHPSDPLSIRFQGINLIPRPIRKGNWDILLLQREAEWIFRLDTVQPTGLNEQLYFSGFI